MNLTLEDIDLFVHLNQSDTGAKIVDYLQRYKLHLSDVETMTKENFEGRKESIKAIQDFIDKIQLVNQPKKSANNQYE